MNPEPLSFFSLTARPPFRRFGWHAFFCLVALYFPLLLVRSTYVSGNIKLQNDSFNLFWGAEQLVVDHTFPLTGNPVFHAFRLGPLAYLLTALPQVARHGFVSSYSFLWLLYVLSPLPIYAAVWRLFRSATAAFAAALWFGVCGSAQEELMGLMLNTSYLPLFLAFYTWLFLRQPQESALLPLYAAIGLCMQLHMTAVFLIPYSLVFLWPGRQKWRVQLPWHLLGLLVVAAMHATVLLDVFLRADLGFATASHSAAPHAAAFDWSVFFGLLTAQVHFGAPLLVAAPVFFLRLTTPGAASRALLGKTAAVVVVNALLSATLNGLRGIHTGDRFFLIELPFLCLTLAAAVSLAERAPRVGPGRLDRLFAGAALVPIMLSLAGACRDLSPFRPHAMLLVHVNNVENLHRWLRTAGVDRVSEVAGVWQIDQDGERCTALPGRAYFPNLFHTMLCYEHPEDCGAAGRGETIRLATFGFARADDVTSFLRTPEQALARPDRCGGPFAASDRVISYFCRGPDDPLQPAVRELPLCD